MRSRGRSSAFLEGRNWLQEAETDLETSQVLSRTHSKNLARRRLFVLQQSLEKLVKSSFPVLAKNLIDFPTILSLGPLIKGKTDVFDGQEYKELSAGIASKLSRFNDFKSLKHDPAGSLGLKSILHSLRTYAVNIGCDSEVVDSLTKAMELYKVRDSSELVRSCIEAYGIATTRGKLLSDYFRTRPVGKYPQEGADYMREYVLPNYSGIFRLFMSYCRLLGYLADYEQSSRYPGMSPVSKSLLSHLDEVESVINRYRRFVASFYREDGLTGVIDDRFFQRRQMK